MRIMALLQAQWWDTRRNPTLVMMAVIALFMSGIYKFSATFSKHGPAEMSGQFEAISLLMCAFFVAFQIASMGLAEEKEKRTLEAVLLTPVHPLEALAGRVILALVAALLVGLGSLAIWWQVPVHAALAAGSYLLLLLFTTAAGMLAGLMAPDQKAVGTTSLPIALLLIFAGMAPVLVPQAAPYVGWLPTHMALQLMQTGFLGGDAPVWQDLAGLLGYTVLFVWLCAWQLRKQAFAR